MPIVPVIPSGQQVAGSQYAGLRPALAVSQYAGQEALPGSRPDDHEPEPQPQPTRDPRKCRHEDGCGGWRQKDSENGLCAGHERAYLKEHRGPTGDEGLH